MQPYMEECIFAYKASLELKLILHSIFFFTKILKYRDVFNSVVGE